MPIGILRAVYARAMVVVRKNHVLTSAVLSSAGNSFLGRSRDPTRLILFAEAF